MGLKRSLKRSVVTAGRLLTRSDLSTRRTVLCYHSVHPNKPYPSTKPESFELQVQWLKTNCHLSSLRDLGAQAADAPDGKPIVALTFDDGYEDHHSYVLPILMKYEIPATFFITTGFVERDPAIVARLAQLWGCGREDVVPLNWAQVRELDAAGMEIGSHTYSHPNLARLTASGADSELRSSKELLGERLGHPVDLFAYPFGKPRVHFTAATTELVKAAGYRIAAAVTFRGLRRRDCRYAIPRFFADGDEIRKLEDKMRGSYDPIGWWQERAPLPLMRAVSPRDFEK